MPQAGPGRKSESRTGSGKHKTSRGDKIVWGRATELDPVESQAPWGTKQKIQKSFDQKRPPGKTSKVPPKGESRAILLAGAKWGRKASFWVMKKRKDVAARHFKKESGRARECRPASVKQKSRYSNRALGNLMKKEFRSSEHTIKKRGCQIMQETGSSTFNTSLRANEEGRQFSEEVWQVHPATRKKKSVGKKAVGNGKKQDRGELERWGFSFRGVSTCTERNTGSRQTKRLVKNGNGRREIRTPTPIEVSQETFLMPES